MWTSVQKRKELVFAVEDTYLSATDVHNSRCADWDTFNWSDNVFFQLPVPSEGRP
jgi:hypothetical protein